MTADITDGRPAVLVTGATSQLGIFILPRLIDRGCRVIAISRDAGHKASTDNPLWLNSECLQPGATSEIQEELAAVEYVISCGPLDLVPELVSGNGNIRRIVAFSTTSVWVKADSSEMSERRQIAQIQQGEKRFKALCAESGIDWLLIRPTLIYGCGRDRNITALAGLIRRLGWLPLAGSASGLRQPVHADDLAQLAVDAMQSTVDLSFESAACGGETLTYREMVKRIFISQEKPINIIKIPALLLVSSVKIFRLFAPHSSISPEMIRRQNRDLAFDDEAVRERLNYSPRGFRPTQDDFSVPSFAAGLQIDR